MEEIKDNWVSQNIKTVMEATIEAGLEFSKDWNLIGMLYSMAATIDAYSSNASIGVIGDKNKDFIDFITQERGSYRDLSFNEKDDLILLIKWIDKDLSKTHHLVGIISGGWYDNETCFTKVGFRRHDSKIQSLRERDRFTENVPNYDASYEWIGNIPTEVDTVLAMFVQ